MCASCYLAWLVYSNHRESPAMPQSETALLSMLSGKNSSEAHATRLIMGTHGRGKLGQLALGSVAHELITNVEIPIFVVGPHARGTIEHVTPRRILHPFSLTGNYRESLRLALEIAQAHRAELTLLHVLDQDIEQSMDPERTKSWAKNALDALVPDATNLAPPVHTTVTSGKLDEEVLKAAIQTNADWIVLGRRRRTSILVLQRKRGL